jgi:hypothetical protein
MKYFEAEADNIIQLKKPKTEASYILDLTVYTGLVDWLLK